MAERDTARPPDPEPEPGVPAGASLLMTPDGSDLRPWDFRQTTRFSAEVVRGIRRLFDHWGPLLQTAVPALTRMPVEVGELRLETMTYEVYARAPVDQGVVAVVLEDSAFAGPCLVRLDESLALVLLDRELGGPGQAVERGRPFSTLEITVMQGPLDIFVRLFEEILRLQMPEATLRIDRVDGASQLQNIAPPTEAVLWVQQSLTLNGVPGTVHVVLPYTAIEPVLGVLVTGQRSDAPSAAVKTVLTPFVGWRHVRVEARLGPVVLTAGQVAGLRPGDVVALNVRVGQGFWMTIEGRPAFLVHDIGRVGIRTAVRVAQQLPKSLLDMAPPGGREDGT